MPSAPRRAACALLLALPLALLACQSGAAPAVPVTTDDGPAPRAAAEVDPSLPVVTVYKTPTCGCCSLWVDHLRGDGFRVETVDLDDVSPIKESRGVPAHLGSCHTAVVGDYVVEGHVPAADVRRLLAEAPEAAGLAVPGMPVGSPGMEHGDHFQPYDVMLIGRDGASSVFAHHAAP